MHTKNMPEDKKRKIYSYLLLEHYFHYIMKLICLKVQGKNSAQTEMENICIIIDHKEGISKSAVRDFRNH